MDTTTLSELERLNQINELSQAVQGLGVLIPIIVILMATLSITTAIISFVFFIKVWRMTNDVREIKAYLKEWLDIEHPVIEPGQVTKEKESELS